MYGLDREATIHPLDDRLQHPENGTTIHRRTKNVPCLPCVYVETTEFVPMAN